jgi:Domain of unknown function (DUF4112)
MPQPKQPEVLPPAGAFQPSRLGSGERFFSNENLDILAHLLDDCFRIPGTQIHFGLDGIVGLVPAIGDVLAGLASCILIFAAWVRGVPYVTLARMASNLALDVIIGAIPFVGDAFDIAWKANRRNYKLLIRHIEQPRKHSWRDWLFLATLAVVIVSFFTIPLLVLAWILDWLFHYM